MRELFISGEILAYDEEERLIALKHKNRINLYYIQRSLLNKIGKYLVVGRFIQFMCYDEQRMYKKYKVYTVDYIIKIMCIRYRKNIVYYDVKNIQTGTKTLINNLKNIMFLDLEMSMHPYNVNKNFKQEIIQAGIYLIGKDDNVIASHSINIQPTIHKKLTKRTTRFLNITQEEIDNGVTFKEFYDLFKELIDKYNPAIMVWGRNDFLALRDAYRINKVPSLAHKTRYINLLKLHKNYFNLKNDLGLFNAYKLYENVDDVQAHNAYEDAVVTYKIFNGFKKVVNKKKYVDTSMYK